MNADVTSESYWLERSNWFSIIVVIPEEKENRWRQCGGWRAKDTWKSPKLCFFFLCQERMLFHAALLRSLLFERNRSVSSIYLYRHELWPCVNACESSLSHLRDGEILGAVRQEDVLGLGSGVWKNHCRITNPSSSTEQKTKRSSSSWSSAKSEEYLLEEIIATQRIQTLKISSNVPSDTEVERFASHFFEEIIAREGIEALEERRRRWNRQTIAKMTNLLEEIVTRQRI